jgi:hypothetical protein
MVLAYHISGTISGAHAVESGAELLSFDRHFAEVDGLAWVDPAAGSA